ncbi:MAG TPA: glycosyltransferase family 39 protein [Vicinamibacterales bacterium]
MIARDLARRATSSSSLGLSISLAHLRVIALAVVLGAAGLTRTAHLATYGFSEDEINKVQAVEEYRQGRFGGNAEHPMLMKLAMWGSVALSERWNALATPEWEIPPETAIRLPNALAGVATTLVLFAVVELLFGAPAAIAASALWALDVNAIAVSRIGKEDTFLLLFFLIAVWCYERAKRQGASDPSGAQRWYVASGAAFGLMLASKYMPQYFPIYALFNTIADPEPGANRPNRRWHLGAMAIAFGAANLVFFLPDTWRYCLAYVEGEMLVHHGAPYAGGLYVTDVPVSPLGMPVTFYLRLIGTHVPLAVLGAAFAGGIELVRRRHERGFVLLRVLLLFLLVPYSLMAAKFLRYALPMFAVIDVMAGVGIVSGVAWLLRKRWLPLQVRVVTAWTAVAVLFVGAVTAPASAAPFFSMFQNAIGERLAPPAVVFPEETYDFGVREAVSAIAGAAGPAAVIVSDAPDVVAHYLKRTTRPDLRVETLSAVGIPREPEVWVIVQDEHLTFENQLLVRQLRGTAPWREIVAGNARAVQVFRIERRIPWSAAS